MSDAYKARIKRGRKRDQAREERRNGKKHTEEALVKTLIKMEKEETFSGDRPKLEVGTSSETSGYESTPGFTCSLKELFPV